MLGARVADRGGDRLALRRGGPGEALAHAARARVDLDLAAGLRVDEPQVAHRRQRLLARVAHLDGEHAVAGAERAQRAFPVALAAEVGDDDDEAARAGGVARAAQRAPRARSRPRRRARARRAAARACRAARRGPGAAGRRAGPRRRRRDAEPVAAAGRDVADRERDALGDVGLAPVGGAEAHRGRHVEHEPGGQRPLGDVDAHVRLLQPGGDVPVDVADVVARAGRPGSRPARCPRRPAASCARPASGSRRGAGSRGRASAGPACGTGPGRAGRACAPARAGSPSRGSRQPPSAHERRRPRRRAGTRARRRRTPRSPAACPAASRSALPRPA